MYAEYRAKCSTDSSNNKDMSENSPVNDVAEIDEKREPRKTPKSAVIIRPPEHLCEQIQSIREKHDKGFIRWMPHINMLWPFLEDINDGEVFIEAKDKLTQALAHVKPFQVSFTKDSFGYFEHKKFCTLWLKPLDETEVEAARATDSKVVDGKEEDVTATEVKMDHMPENVEEQEAKANQERGGSQERTENLLPSATGFTDVKPKSKRKKNKGKKAIQRPTPHRPHIPFHGGVISLQKRLEEALPECNDLGSNFEGFKPHLSLGQFKAKTVEDDLTTFQADWNEFSFEVNEVYMISRKDFHDPFHVQHTIPLGGLKDG